MWKCQNCNEQVEDNFDVCWNCGTKMDGRIDEEFQSVVVDDSDETGIVAESQTQRELLETINRRVGCLYLFMIAVIALILLEGISVLLWWMKS